MNKIGVKAETLLDEMNAWKTFDAAHWSFPLFFVNIIKTSHRPYYRNEDSQIRKLGVCDSAIYIISAKKEWVISATSSNPTGLLYEKN